ncbi:MAG: cysteine desulfurase family protein [Pirellulales bacterium]
MTPIYLDNNSTTPIASEVVAAMTECYAAQYVNPASQHQRGQQARRRLETARESIAEILGAEVTSFQSDTVVFTSGGTEANNLAMFGMLPQNSAPGNIVISAIEHPSIIATADQLKQRGYEIRTAKVDQQGTVDVTHCLSLIDEQTQLVSIMLGNNETGVLQPVAEIAKVCRERKVLCHTDAAQVVGKLSVHFRELDVDAMTVTPHKLYGPRGIGALLLRNGVELQPQLHGGFQQLGARPGTESVELAVGFAAALELWQRDSESRPTKLRHLRDLFEQVLLEKLPWIVINGSQTNRLPHTSNIAFPGVDRQALLIALDMTGVYCSTGSACASGSSELSPVLLAMQCPEPVIQSSLRFSLGCNNTETEVTLAIDRISNAANNLRS